MVLGKRVVGARQKSRRCSAKESSVLGKRIVGAQQKNRRCSAKESTMLRGSSQYTLKYQLTAMHREVIIRDKIIVFPLGFREVFHLLLSSLWIHLEQHHRAGRIRKRFLFFR